MDQLDAALQVIHGVKHHFNALLVLLTLTAIGVMFQMYVLFAILIILFTLFLQNLLDVVY